MTVSTPQNPQYIMVQEEYGYRHWIGVLPQDMTRDDVISWWKSLPSVGCMFFNPSASFPMPLIELEDIADDDADKATWQWVDAQGEHILDRKNVVLFCHVHEDDDSYMKIPQGETFYHAGYGEWEQEEDEESPTDQELIEEAKKYPALKSLLDNVKDSV